MHSPTRPTTDLRPHPAVAALHRWSKTCPDFQLLCESVKEHGLLQPLIITPDGAIMDGITRWQACQAVGRTTVEVVERPETDLAFVAIGSETERRHLTKGQIAFKYYPLVESFFDDLKELKAQRNALPNGQRGGLAHSVRYAEKRVNEFAAKLGISVRLLEQVRQLDTLFEETDSKPRVWTSGDARKILEACGMDPDEQWTPRQYISAAIMENPEPMSPGGAIAGLKFIAEADAAEERGREHTGNRPTCTTKQLNLFNQVLEQELTRWEYWESASEAQRKEHFDLARKKADELPAEKCEQLADYHRRMARLFERKSKES